MFVFHTCKLSLVCLVHVCVWLGGGRGARGGYNAAPSSTFSQELSSDCQALSTLSCQSKKKKIKTPPTANKLTLHRETNRAIRNEGGNCCNRDKWRDEDEEGSGDYVRTGGEKGGDSGKSGSE